MVARAPDSGAHGSEQRGQEGGNAEGGTGERGGWIRFEEGGQGRSCDKEVRMKDVASVQLRGK